MLIDRVFRAVLCYAGLLIKKYKCNAGLLIKNAGDMQVCWLKNASVVQACGLKSAINLFMVYAIKFSVPYVIQTKLWPTTHQQTT